MGSAFGMVGVAGPKHAKSDFYCGGGGSGSTQHAYCARFVTRRFISRCAYTTKRERLIFSRPPTHGGQAIADIAAASCCSVATLASMTTDIETKLFHDYGHLMVVYSGKCSPLRVAHRLALRHRQFGTGSLGTPTSQAVS